MSFSDRSRRSLAIAAFAGVIACVVCGSAWMVWAREMSSTHPPERASFAEQAIQRGAQLAAIGNCAGCHTLPGNAPYAGGVPLATPFGTIYGTNITPGAATGIGNWSEAAFIRAMREGIARDGHHLYPAFPYDHFTLLSDEELRALYAFMMTRTPVQAQAPANDLRFPFNIRATVAVWNLLYLDKKPRAPATAESSEMQRGAHLVDALAHIAVPATRGTRHENTAASPTITVQAPH